MSQKILFVGAGAVGSYLASFFARAGHDVTVIDSWPEQVETIRPWPRTWSRAAARRSSS